MNTQTITAALPQAHRRARWSPRLVSAEFLKLRKRRGLVLSALLLTAGSMLIAYTVLLAVHATDPAHHGPAGGLENFAPSMDLLWGMSVIAAILVGSTLGTGDLGAGVFRELVVTGRSRLALFAARVPAGLGLLLPIVGIAFGITATAATMLAGSTPTQTVHGGFDLGNVAPGGTLLLHSAGWLALVTGVSFVLALGVSSLIGSRGASIGILLGWFLVAMPLLLEYGRGARVAQGLFIAATDHFKPTTLFEGAAPAVPMSFGAAVIVLLGWAFVPLALGAWRTCTRDA